MVTENAKESLKEASVGDEVFSDKDMSATVLPGNTLKGWIEDYENGENTDPLFVNMMEGLTKSKDLEIEEGEVYLIHTIDPFLRVIDRDRIFSVEEWEKEYGEINRVAVK